MTGVEPKPDIASSIWIARPPEDVWNYLIDVSHDTQWRDGVNEAQWTSDPPHGVGSTGLHIIEGVGDWPWQATAVTEPRVLAWDVTGGRFKGSHGAYRLEPEGDGTRFTLETRMKRSILISLLMLVLKGRITQQNVIDLEKLKTIMEG